MYILPTHPLTPTAPVVMNVFLTLLYIFYEKKKNIICFQIDINDLTVDSIEGANDMITGGGETITITGTPRVNLFTYITLYCNFTYIYSIFIYSRIYSYIGTYI